MRLKNVLIVVENVEKSRDFYKELFGLQVISDFGENVMMTEGLVLQEKKIWEKQIGHECTSGGDCAELYFVESDLDRFIEKMEESEFKIEIVNEMAENSFGKRRIRIYDPDHHIIEIGE